MGWQVRRTDPGYPDILRHPNARNSGVHDGEGSPAAAERHSKRRVVPAFSAARSLRDLPTTVRGGRHLAKQAPSRARGGIRPSLRSRAPRWVEVDQINPISFFILPASPAPVPKRARAAELS